MVGSKGDSKLVSSVLLWNMGGFTISCHEKKNEDLTLMSFRQENGRESRRVDEGNGRGLNNNNIWWPVPLICSFSTDHKR